MQMVKSPNACEGIGECMCVAHVRAVVPKNARRNFHTRYGEQHGGNRPRGSSYEGSTKRYFYMYVPRRMRAMAYDGTRAMAA